MRYLPTVDKHGRSRRLNVSLNTPEEHAITKLINKIEFLAERSPHLTECVSLLTQAKHKLADHLERP